MDGRCFRGDGAGGGGRCDPAAVALQRARVRLSFPAFVLLVVASFVGLDVWTRASYRTKGGLNEKITHFAETAGAGPNLVILGTCLPEQHLRAEILSQALGGTVHNLGVEATSPLDWYLAFANGLPHDRIDGLVLAYGEADLQAEILPYESRVMDLARLGDMPDLLSEVCSGVECKVDLLLRWAWPTWRYRVRIANRVWSTFDALPLQQAAAPPPRRYQGAPMRYVRRLIRRARAEDIPVWMVPLPRRPEPGRVPPPSVAEEAKMIAEEGAVLVPTPKLDASNFESDVHLTGAGAFTLSHAVAETLGEKLKAGAAVRGAGAAP